MRGDKTTAGRRPACLVPLTGSKSTQAMSPASGSIFPTQDVFQGDLAAGIGVIDDFGSDVRPPINQFRLVLRLHLRNQILQAIPFYGVCRLETQFSPVDLKFELRPLAKAGGV